MHDHDYVSICCTAPIIKGSEVYVSGADTKAISGSCDACGYEFLVECLDCESDLGGVIDDLPF
jgi:hypothetical protein